MRGILLCWQTVYVNKQGEGRRKRRVVGGAGPSSWERSLLPLHWLMAIGKKALLALLESFLLSLVYIKLAKQVARAGLAIKFKQLVCVKYTQPI